MEHVSIRSALRQVAREKGVSIDVVYQEIERVIESGMSSEDPLIRKRWGEIPARGEVPTVEELMEHLLQRVMESWFCTK